jgi:serine phosphatase RsbU (regulator of sigma subunit)/anti-sigma regulatory factor (Ser/Thr protein kinase)
LAARQPVAKLARATFLGFFVIYTAGSIAWLLSGLPPVLAAQVPSVHATLHQWGAGNRAYLVASKKGLKQQATAGARTVQARELAFRAGEEFSIRLDNRERGVAHSVLVVDGTGKEIDERETVTNRSFKEYRFAALPPGTYFFTDGERPGPSRKFVVVDGTREIPAVIRWVPGIATIAAGAALDAHLTEPAPELILQYLFSALNLGLGFLLIRLRPRDLAARLLALGMIGTAAVFNLQAHSTLEEIPRLGVLLHDGFHVATGLAYIYALLVFPDGKLVPRWAGPQRWKWQLRAVALAAVTVTAVVFFSHRRLHGDPGGFVVLFGVLIPVAGVTSQALRLRQASSADEREQSRLLIWALTLALGVALVLIGLGRLINRSGLREETINDLYRLSFLVFPVLFAVIPVTLTVVLVRYRLWEIDRVINQTLVYGTLTGVLGVTYVTIVVVLTIALGSVTRGSELAVAVSTLAAAALFRPVRDYIQAFIDRRFYRGKYDAARTLEAFSAKLRDELDLGAVTGELLGAAEQTMQPTRMSLWLGTRDDIVEDLEAGPSAAAGERTSGTMIAPAPATMSGVVMTALARSAWRGVRRPLRRGEREPRRAEALVSDHAGQAEIVPVAIDRGDPIVAAVQAAAVPVDLDGLELASPARDALRAAGMRVSVPLVSRGELVGMLSLGRRRSGRDYSGDDRKLLDGLAKRAAPPLRVAQLVRDLVRQRALELHARERMEQELQVAQLIQQQFLPRQLPELPGWRIAAYYQPARAVGGDFYDFIDLPDGLLGITCGDVTDKGVPAALVMAITHSILRGDASRLISPGKVLARVNERLCAEIPPPMFVTCFYGVLDPATGHLRYANAGHNPPYAHTQHGVVELRATGMPLGLMPAMAYEELETTLDPGQSLLFHSDGLVEAHDPQRNMFGFPRLARLVGETAGGQVLIDRLLRELDGFTGSGWEQEDDITLVTIERGSPAATAARSGPAGTRILAEFSLPSELGSERRAMARVIDAVGELNLPAARIERLRTAVVEAVMNAIEHGNQNRKELPVDVAVLASAESLSVRVTDAGNAHALPPPEPPDVEAKLDGLQPPRGWGLFLIKHMVDDMLVTNNDQRRVVELVFHLKGDASG